jgi:hypothetical protein
MYIVLLSTVYIFGEQLSILNYKIMHFMHQGTGLNHPDWECRFTSDNIRRTLHARFFLILLRNLRILFAGFSKIEFASN